jgi:hypothetical protein
MTNKVICLFVHYFDKNAAFDGRSKHQLESVRREIVTRALSALQSVKGVDVSICGFKDRHLVPIDIDLSERTDNPQFMMYEALGSLQEYRGKYDYFMVVEDDILVGPDVFNSTYEFDRQFSVDQIFLPNRLEIDGQKVSCVDTYWNPGTTGDKADFNHRQLKVFKNPHSGLLIVSKEKLDYLVPRVDAAYREKFIGGFMASAFAHYHRPFRLYRVADGYDFHTIMHLDRYVPPKRTPLELVRGVVARLIRRLA